MQKVLKIVVTVDPENESVHSTLEEGRIAVCPKCKHCFNEFDNEKYESTEKEQENE